MSVASVVGVVCMGPRCRGWASAKRKIAGIGLCPQGARRGGTCARFLGLCTMKSNGRKVRTASSSSDLRSAATFSRKGKEGLALSLRESGVMGQQRRGMFAPGSPYFPCGEPRVDQPGSETSGTDAAGRHPVVTLRAGRLNGLKFRRQHPVGPYIADFFCRCVWWFEIDGQIHGKRPARDAARTGGCRDGIRAADSGSRGSAGS